MGLYKQEGSKNWYIDFYDENGKRVRECTKTTNKALANKILAKRLEDVRLRKFGMDSPDPLLFEKLMEKFFGYAESEIKPLTYKRYKVSSNQLKEFFTGKYIERITALEIEEYKQDRLNKVSRATVNRDLALLRRMFNQAKKWDLITKSPMEKVDFLREDNIRTRYLEKEELDRLLNECRAVPHLYLAVIIAVHTGMRKQEILDLRIPGQGVSLDKVNWVDIENRYFHLNVTKTSKHRKVPINEQVLPPVERAIKESSASKLFKVKNIRRVFENARNKAGIDDFTFHDLRRTFISHAMMAGYSQEVIQRVVGQDDPSIFKRYAHLSPDVKKEVVREVGNMFESLLLSTRSIINWESFISMLKMKGGAAKSRILDLLDEGSKRILSEYKTGENISRESKDTIIRDLNRILNEDEEKLYVKDVFLDFKWTEEGNCFLQKGYEKLNRREITRFNRLILETVFGSDISPGQRLF